MIDVHCHLPQYPVVACGGQELLPWLKKFVFPCERAFSPKKARIEAPLFFSELKRYGITAAAVYTTVDAKSTQVCFRAAQASRLRIAMGQMMMDVDSYAPKPHKNLTQSVLNESRAELVAVKSLFPSSKDYTHVYESFGLLGPRTVMGHAIYLSAREYRALAAD